MENWIIITKLTILLYCVLRYSISDTVNIAAAVTFTLVYISINILLYMVNKVKYKELLISVSILLCLGYFQYVNDVFVLLVPMNIFELIITVSKNLWLTIMLIIIPTFILKNYMLFEYIFISLLSFIIYMLTYKLHMRIQELTMENDEMRENMHILSSKLNKNADYEKQIIYLSQLEERNKMSQYIHDRLGHTIAGSLMQLEAAKIFVTNDSEKSKEIIQKVIDILREGMESIRVTLKNLKPASEQMGINKIKLILDEFTLNNSMKTLLIHKGNLEYISHIQWKIIQDNLVEALTNSLKYSNATSISVNIEVLNKFIKAEVKDNGTGASLLNKGLGIKGMEERSASIGGKLIVDGSNGFSVITLLPL